jgi:hypothetical protein
VCFQWGNAAIAVLYNRRQGLWVPAWWPDDESGCLKIESVLGAFSG